MNAMLYLIRKEIKNSLMEMIHHPTRLIINLAVIALLGFSLLSGTKTKNDGGYLDFRILHGIYLGILLLIGLPSIFSGLKSGATFFKMSDVNFLFVSPISPKRILAYGLVKQMASTLLMMLFLLFYGGMAANAFGVVTWQIITLIAGIALLVFTIQVITLLIYSFSNGNPRRVNAVKAGIYAVLAVIAGLIVFLFLSNGSDMESLLAAISSPYLAYVPVVGWLKGLVFAIILSKPTEILVFGALTLFAVAGSILLFANSNTDYFEDVLQSTETTFELQKSMKEGRTFQTRPGKQVKVRDTGIHHGWGANTFFFKQLRQGTRKSRIPIVGVSSIVLIAANVILAMVLQNIGKSENDPIPTGILMAICLLASAYILFFFNAAGDWTMELMKPYIYLVPESSFSKLLWASLTTLLKPAIDGVLIFAVLGIFVRANPLTAVLCMLVYASTGAIFTAANVLSQRVLGSVSNKGLMMVFYMILLIALLAPGIGGSVLIYTLAGYLPGVLIGLPIVVSNILVSVGVYAACRNVLSNAEMNNA